MRSREQMPPQRSPLPRTPAEADAHAEAPLPVGPVTRRAARPGPVVIYLGSRSRGAREPDPFFHGRWRPSRVTYWVFRWLGRFPTQG